jgi:hypothetical protein
VDFSQILPANPILAALLTAAAGYVLAMLKSKFPNMPTPALPVPKPPVDPNNPPPPDGPEYRALVLGRLDGLHLKVDALLAEKK